MVEITISVKKSDFCIIMNAISHEIALKRILYENSRQGKKQDDTPLLSDIFQLEKIHNELSQKTIEQEVKNK